MFVVFLMEVVMNLCSFALRCRSNARGGMQSSGSRAPPPACNCLACSRVDWCGGRAWQGYLMNSILGFGFEDLFLWQVLAVLQPWLMIPVMNPMRHQLPIFHLPMPLVNLVHWGKLLGIYVFVGNANPQIYIYIHIFLCVYIYII